MLYGTIEYLLNLVEYCNGDNAQINLTTLLNVGDFTSKLKQIVRVPNTPLVDLTIFEQLSSERVQELVAIALQAGDTTLAMEYIQRLQAQQGGNA